MWIQDKVRAYCDYGVFQYCSQENGMTLVEVLAAVAILSILSVGFAGVAIQSLNTMVLNTQRVQALEYARATGIQLRDRTHVAPFSVLEEMNGIKYTVVVDLGIPLSSDPDLLPNTIRVLWSSLNTQHQIQLTVYTEQSPTP